jgi:tRNA threonylcarbamoyladenosine biosynthesis protein TsaB
MILLIETSGLNCSVGLVSTSGELHVAEATADHFIHAESLHPLMGNLLQKHRQTWQDIQAVAVSLGPGSYTGLRIGVSSAKGLAYALNIPIIGIRTSESLARFAKKNQPGFLQYWSMIDAKRMEVYCASFDASGVRLVDDFPCIINDQLTENQAQPILFVGDGAAKCSPFIRSSDAILHLQPSAEMLAEIAIERWNAQQFEDTAYCEPFYLKDYIPGVSKKNTLL